MNNRFSFLTILVLFCLASVAVAHWSKGLSAAAAKFKSKMKGSNHSIVPVQNRHNQHQARPTIAALNAFNPYPHVRELGIEPQFGYFHQSTFYEMPNPDDFSVVFGIKGKLGGGILRFSPEDPDINRNCPSCIDIVFGSTDNTGIDIVYALRREYSQHIVPIYNARVVPENDFRTFWVNFKGGEVAVGFGDEIYRNVVVSYRDDALEQYFNWTSKANGKPFLKDITHVGFSSDESLVFFHDIKFGPGYVPRSTPSAPVVTNPGAGIVYVTYHFPRMWEVSATDFEVEFEAQGLSDLLIGFLTDYRYITSQPTAYEVLLDEGFETPGHKKQSSINVGTGRGGLMLANYSFEVMSSVKFNPFWIRLKNGLFEVGKGREVGKNTFMSTEGKSVPPTGTETLYFVTGSYFFSNSFRLLAIKSLPVGVEWRLDEPWTEDPGAVRSVPISFKTGTNEPYHQYRGKQECNGHEFCTPPTRPFIREMPTVMTRNQWWHHGAFCAEAALQAISLHYGVYLSQAMIRKVAPNHHNKAYFFAPGEGFELSDVNMNGTLRALGFKYDMWDSDQPIPQIMNFLTWVKASLVKGYPVIWAVRYFEPYNYDHMEPVWGIRSNHPLTDNKLYLDDVFSHNFGVLRKRFYREASTLWDSNTIPTSLDTNGGNNCTLSQLECLFRDYNYGFAIKGLEDPVGRLIPTSIEVSDNGYEPFPPFVGHNRAKVMVRGPLVVGMRYRIYRYDDYEDYPRDSLFERSNYKKYYEFVASHETHFWHDLETFPSNQGVYYITTGVTFEESDDYENHIDQMFDPDTEGQENFTEDESPEPLASNVPPKSQLNGPPTSPRSNDNAVASYTVSKNIKTTTPKPTKLIGKAFRDSRRCGHLKDSSQMSACMKKVQSAKRAHDMHQVALLTKRVKNMKKQCALYIKLLSASHPKVVNCQHSMHAMNRRIHTVQKYHRAKSDCITLTSMFGSNDSTVRSCRQSVALARLEMMKARCEALTVDFDDDDPIVSKCHVKVQKFAKFIDQHPGSDGLNYIPHQHPPAHKTG